MGRRFVSASSTYLGNASFSFLGVPGTIACWFYPTTATQSTDLVLADDGTPSNVASVAISGNAVSTSFLSANDGTSASSSVYNPATNRWMHACGRARILSGLTYVVESYINGVGGSETSSSGISLPATMNVLRIGGDPESADFSTYFNGLIAHAAVWNVALTDAEIHMLAQGTLPTKIRPQNLAAYWPLNTPGSVWEFDANPANPRGFDLTLTGTAPAIDSPMQLDLPWARRRRKLLGIPGSNIPTVTTWLLRA